MQIKHTIRDSGHNNEVIVWGEGGGVPLYVLLPVNSKEIKCALFQLHRS